jgi:hypothetical protein
MALSPILAPIPLQLSNQGSPSGPGWDVPLSPLKFQSAGSLGVILCCGGGPGNGIRSDSWGTGTWCDPGAFGKPIQGHLFRLRYCCLCLQLNWALWSRSCQGTPRSC